MKARRPIDAGQADHWTGVYARKDPEEVSWFEREPTRSLALIAAAGLSHEAAILDVRGGTSSLTARLAVEGYTDLTVLDISPTALDRARGQAGPSADRICWVQADVRTHEFGRQFDVWHDRAVFHFMVSAESRAAYLSALRDALKPGGHLLLATFGPEGPTECSGLPTARYDARRVSELLGGDFQIISSGLDIHHTPTGRAQQFLYTHCRREHKLTAPSGAHSQLI